jgi:hypothetical protein
MKAILTPILAAVVFLTGCGDDLVNNVYEGDPLVTVQGNLQIAPTQRPNDTLQVTLVWNVEDRFDYKINQNTEVTGDNIGQYTLNVLLPPPDQALNVDPETGGRIGFAWIMAYDDPRKEGPIDLSKIVPSQYKDLIYRWRGGSEDIQLAYVHDSFSEGTRVANALGGPIEPGFYLVRFIGDCYCYPGTHGRCVDSGGNSCDRSEMTIISPDTSVDLNIVDDIADFKMVPSPDWLFLDD